MSVDTPLEVRTSLRALEWPRQLESTNSELLEKLYVPALARAVQYDRACAYFTSGVLAVAARGFGGLIENLLKVEKPQSPAIRLLVNVQLDSRDLRALLASGDYSGLEKDLLKGLRKPQDAFERSRLEMLGWLVKKGWLEARVGVMAETQGINHAKFGVIIDKLGNALAFTGSGNETEAALRENFEVLDIYTSWDEGQRCADTANRFHRLWSNEHPHVRVFSLPEAVRQKLISFAPKGTKRPAPELIIDRDTTEAAMLWHFVAAVPYLPNGDLAMDATAPVSMWEHQKSVVDDTAAAFPAGRLLCDEVGMGKTVEAIMTLRRLLAGRGVKRALLLVPAGLLGQWQAELREKGGLLVPILDGGYLKQPGGKPVKADEAKALRTEPLLLMSREWARLPANREALFSAPPWDLLLLDEAHHARRAAQKETEFNSANLLLELLRQFQLRRRARGLMLLSATPMQTSPWEPWDLLQVLGVGGEWLVDFADIRSYYDTISRLRKDDGDLMLDVVERLLQADGSFPPFKQPIEMLPFLSSAEKTQAAEYLHTNAPLARYMHRNTRDTLRAYHARGWLADEPPRRDVQDILFDYQHDGEREAYDEVAAYINERFENLEKERGGKGFVMTVYQRRASSSPYALRRSLGRRAALCQKVVDQHARSEILSVEDEELDYRDLGDINIDERVDAAAPKTPQAAKEEIEQIGALLAMIDALGGQDSKLARFAEELYRITSDGRAVLVFTEYSDTMQYLRSNLEPAWGDMLACYSGDGGLVRKSGKWITVSKSEITERLASSKIRVLVCTDAASEGLNLQSASALINYDLPWNPSKVEQRIGRIDRIGQKQQLLPVRNLFLRDSVDEAVYGALRRRCGLFEHFVGTMQPVLSVVRDELRRNLQRDRVAEVLRKIENKVGEERADSVAAAIYAPSEAIKMQSGLSSLSIDDLTHALGLLSDSKRRVSATKRGASWSIRNAGKSRLVATERDALEQNEEVQPFTLFAAASIARELPLNSAMPLVVGEAEDGAFRATEVRWVAQGTSNPVESFDQLLDLLMRWDGVAPDASERSAAHNAAMEIAARRVAEAGKRAQAEQDSAHKRQRLAARSRLLLALACHLRLQNRDIGVVFKREFDRETDSNGIYHIARNLLNGWPLWDEHHRRAANAFVESIAESERQRLFNTASLAVLGAALNDPRWAGMG